MCLGCILQSLVVALDSMGLMCVLASAQPIDRGLGERMFGKPEKLHIQGAVVALVEGQPVR